MNKIFLVASREFKTRVQKKTFLLSTIGLPILIFGFYALMIYFQVKTTDNFKVAVSDQSKLFNGKIDDRKSTEVIFSFMDADTVALNKKLNDGAFDAYLFIPNGYNLQSGEPQISFRSSKALGLMTREKIENRISNALEEKKLLALNISKGQLDSARLENNAISFTTTYQTSRTARFSSKEGKVKAIIGDICEISVAKKVYVKNIADVSPTDAPNVLTYALFGTCKCDKEATPNGD